MFTGNCSTEFNSSSENFLNHLFCHHLLLFSLFVHNIDVNITVTDMSKVSNLQSRVSFVDFSYPAQRFQYPAPWNADVFIDFKGGNIIKCRRDSSPYLPERITLIWGFCGNNPE